ncbi:MAG: sodium:calcium antiporter [Candidatus Bathyarchaeia archaeon]|nr:sodium:calcium antiporter [Candidatus Bathyarchaeota archaeon A05DMB-5]
MIELIIQVSILILSLIVLAIASHFTIKYVENLIMLTGLSEASVGFAILAVMTSTPEIAVALFSAIQGTPGISVGDVLGSNVFNISMIIGILATLGYLKKCRKDLMIKLTDILILTSIIPFILILFNMASRFVGALLLGIFAFNIFIMTRKRTPSVDEPLTVHNKLVTVLMVIIGVAIVILAARFAVSSAVNIAITFGVPPITIGAKIVAIGTSLPELSLDLTAARRGRIQLALGDIIGSNLTNLTLVLGLLLISSPFTVDISTFAEIIPFVLITTVIFWRYLTKGYISQTVGITLILLYVLFQAIF